MKILETEETDWKYSWDHRLQSSSLFSFQGLESLLSWKFPPTEATNRNMERISSSTIRCFILSEENNRRCVWFRKNVGQYARNYMVIKYKTPVVIMCAAVSENPTFCCQAYEHRIWKCTSASYVRENEQLPCWRHSEFPLAASRTGSPQHCCS